MEEGMGGMEGRKGAGLFRDGERQGGKVREGGGYEEEATFEVRVWLREGEGRRRRLSSRGRVRRINPLTCLWGGRNVG